MNRRHPWYVEAEHRDAAGETLRFESRRFWDDPTGKIAVGRPITVWHVPGEPGVHDVDLDALAT